MVMCSGEQYKNSNKQILYMLLDVAFLKKINQKYLPCIQYSSIMYEWDIKTMK